MATAVTVTVSGRKADEIPLATEDLMREVGLLVRERIVRRTLSGLDYRNAPFTPYSLGYATRKAAEVGPGLVNLQLSGDLLNAITITGVTHNTVTLGFSR